MKRLPLDPRDPPNLRRYAPHPAADDVVPSASQDAEIEAIVEARESVRHERHDEPRWRRRYWR